MPITVATERCMPPAPPWGNGSSSPSPSTEGRGRAEELRARADTRLGGRGRGKCRGHAQVLVEEGRSRLCPFTPSARDVAAWRQAGSTRAVRRHEQSDAEWSRIEPLLGSRTGPRSKRGDRDFINAVVWRVKPGFQWRDLPERFGHWKTVYNRFHRWTKTGRWEAIFKALRLLESRGAARGLRSKPRKLLYERLVDVLPAEVLRTEVRRLLKAREDW
ncbi:transposase [Corallococcus sp. AB011P]|nr:transposase [Corallococcus sp. AB011P]